jgi:hypothetical protein
MKKYGVLLMLFLALTVGTAFAQTTYVTKTEPDQVIHISGTVQTKQGDILHLAFVQDKHYKNGTYTDSLGNFELNVNATSKLFVSCRGFKDTVFDINNRTSFLIILTPYSAPASRVPVVADVNNNINIATLRDEMQLNEPAVPGTIRAHLVTPGINGVKYTMGPGDFDMHQGAIYPQFHHKDETQGSRYLFGGWMHGYVINNQDSLIQNPVLLFNYDKMGGSLLLTKDKNAAIEIYKDLIKSFTLFDALNQPMTFTMVPDIDKTHFVQVIASGVNYKIYKLTRTRFVVANFATDGVASTGNNFDSYEDEATYYVFDAKTNQLQKLPSLKKKAIKEMFAKEPDKLNKFIADNSASSIDDSYLAGLGDYMNK